MIELIDVSEPLKLDDYAELAHLAGAVHDVRQSAAAVAPALEGRTLWMISSTAAGGGVAEMMPKLVSLLNELGVRTRWAVIHTDRPEFFQLTKRLHNLLHGQGEPGFTEDDRMLYESVNSENATDLGRHLKRRDILVVHDPQPMAAGALLKREAGVCLLWRCHIGTDRTTAQVTAAWDFLQPYAGEYDHATFTAAEYIPPYFQGRATIVPPSIDPLDHKNRHLAPKKMMGILCNAGLAVPYEPVLMEAWKDRARRLQADGTFAVATEPDNIGLIYRPIITQVSRWDRLKGWTPLLEGFAKLKGRLESRRTPWPEHHRKRLEMLRLVLAGPDPGAVSDDPEAAGVLEELRHHHAKLPPAVQKDVVLLMLPMTSRKENALMVNVLQSCSSVVVQNSIEEGFGLTAAEAMYKGCAVLGTHACGLRKQIRHGVDGHLVRNATDPEEVAAALDEMLADSKLRDRYGRNAQRRVHEEFLIFAQLRRWLSVLEGCTR